VRFFPPKSLVERLELLSICFPGTVLHLYSSPLPKWIGLSDFLDRTARTKSSPSQVLKRISSELANQDNLPSATPSSHSYSLPLPPQSLSSRITSPSFASSSFAQSAATALTSNLPLGYPSVSPLPLTQDDYPADFSNFLGTLTSEDWTSTGFGSPAGASDSLLGQLTW